MDEWIVVYNRRTGRKLPNRVPRSYLRIFPHLSETPASRTQVARRRPARRSGASRFTATPASRAATPRSDLQEESHATQGD